MTILKSVEDENIQLSPLSVQKVMIVMHPEKFVRYPSNP